jgi:hypothetical protein
MSSSDSDNDFNHEILNKLITSSYNIDIITLEDIYNEFKNMEKEYDILLQKQKLLLIN